MKLDLKIYDDLPEGEIRDKLIPYKEKGFQWWDGVIEPGLCVIHTPHQVYREKEIIKYFKTKKIKFGDEDKTYEDIKNAANLLALVRSKNNSVRDSDKF